MTDDVGIRFLQVVTVHDCLQKNELKHLFDNTLTLLGFQQYRTQLLQVYLVP